MYHFQSAILNSPQRESSEQDFLLYARPLTSKLLESMEMAKHYYHGDGDYLFYEQNNKIHRVLDLTGGYGANLLGHRHPRILNKVREWSETGSPSLTQGSIRNESGRLARRISDILKQETGEGPWVSTFSNSGTEAVEAALKHCLIYFQHRLIQLEQEIEKEMNQALVKFKRTNASLQKDLLYQIRKDLTDKIEKLRMSEERKCFFLHEVSRSLDIDTLISVVRNINKLQTATRPSFVALEKAYHGKTMGALSLTYSESFRHPFYLDTSNNLFTHFISPYQDAVSLQAFIESTLIDTIFLTNSSTGITWAKHSFSTLAGAFVEPIQGEAGVHQVPEGFLALLKKHSLQEDFLLVFDEIQSGMYRTGKLAAATHSNITPDIYTFSKSLGGGVAKIAATAIHGRKYIEDFGFLHTSTFADDGFSANIAMEVLDIIHAPDSPLAGGMMTADYLMTRLDWLKSTYPDVIKEHRGTGLMLAIEFQDLFVTMGFEFKTIVDAKMQGYMMASALLNHENLRMNPSLSNNLTLRIQPSLYFTLVQVEELIAGLINMCEAFKAKKISYFLSALYPNDKISDERTPDLITEFIPGKRPLAVFLCHLIDEAHVKKVTKALSELPGIKLLSKLAMTKELAEFDIYHAQTITDTNGVEMDIIMMGIAVTSEELKKSFLSRNKYKIVQKVQNAVDYAKSLGATTVGLGQFTSIVSGNGLYLNPQGMNLTTGNAYTIGLTIQSALRSAREKQVELSNATAVLIGAAGNIMSVASSIMADHMGKIILLHHSPVESSLKYQVAVKRILDEVAESDSTTRVVQVVKKHWKKGLDLLSFLSLPEVAEVFKVSSEVTDIQQADIVLCGTSASNGFLSLDLFKHNAVVVDVAVPPTIKPELLAKLEAERPDLTYHLGGVAQIPNGQSIDFFVFPLGHNESYACMAETFAIGFSGKKNFLNIGDLNKAIVTEVEKIALSTGFVLGRNKDKSSL